MERVLAQNAKQAPDKYTLTAYFATELQRLLHTFAPVNENKTKYICHTNIITTKQKTVAIVSLITAMSITAMSSTAMSSTAMSITVMSITVMKSTA